MPIGAKPANVGLMMWMLRDEQRLRFSPLAPAILLNVPFVSANA